MSLVDFSSGNELDLPDISKISNELEKMFPDETQELREVLTALYKNRFLVELRRTRDLKLPSLKENILITSDYYGIIQEGLKVIAKGLEVPIYFLCSGCLLGEDYNKYLTDAIYNLEESHGGAILVLEDLDLLRYDTGVDSNVSKEREKLASSILKQLLSSSYWKTERFNGDLASSYVGDISFVGIGGADEIVRNSFSRVIGIHHCSGPFNAIEAFVQNSPIMAENIRLLKELGIDLVLEPSFVDFIRQTVRSYGCDSLPSAVTRHINGYMDDALLELFSSGNKDLETSIPSKKYDELHLKEPDSSSKHKPYQLVKKMN